MKVEAPQMIMPTRTDSNNVQPGGLDETTLKEKVDDTETSFHKKFKTFDPYPPPRV